MYLKDQQYMNALALSGSMTKASKMLGISQPALSKWLASLEAQLKTPLFLRSSKHLLLTEAGQIYLHGCQECLNTASEIRRQAKALSHPSRTSITLGGSAIRGAQAFAKIFQDFRKRYPEINLFFVADLNQRLKEMLADGSITMSLLGATETSVPNLEYLKFMDEELLLMVPKGHPLFYDYKTLAPNQPIPVLEDLSVLKDTPILANESYTSYSNLVDELYRNAGLTSNIIFRTGIIPLLYEMVLNGVGTALVPDSYYNPDDDVSVYSLSPRIIVYQGIGIRRGYQLSEAEEYLIHLVMNSWGSPYYMHQYADYYLEQRKERINTYEYNKF